MLGRLWQITTVTASLLIGAIVFAFTFNILHFLLFAGLAYAIFTAFQAEIRTLAPILTLLFILGYFGLIGVIQFIIAVSVIIALFALKDIRLTGDNIYRTVFYPLRIAILPVIFLFLPIAIIYLLWRGLKVQALMFKIYSILAAFLLIVFLFSHLSIMNTVDYNVGFLGDLLSLNPSMLSPITWLGVVAYEELFTRPLGGVGNAFFVLYHMPSRYATLEIFAIAAIMLIALATFWLWDSYKYGGIVGSIISHVVYNTMIMAFVALPIAVWPTLMIVSFILYFTFKKP